MPRDYSKVQWASLRSRVDNVIDELHDELTDCYYNYWKLGESKPWSSHLPANKQLDVRPGAKATKTQFDLAHGLLGHLHILILFKINRLDGDYDEDAMFSTLDEDGNVTDSLTQVKLARAYITNLADTYGLDVAPMKNYIVNWCQSTLAKTIELD